MTKKKILLIFGTRPEAIKLAPVVLSLRESGSFQVKVAVTAQHRQMLDQVLNLFGLVPDYDLDLMTPGQDLFAVTVRVLAGLKEVLRRERPDLVVVQGDTTTSFAGALAAYYEKSPVAHVEAGLRTRQKYAPFLRKSIAALPGCWLTTTLPLRTGPGTTSSPKGCPWSGCGSPAIR